ncbi:nuclear transport factor 2 family protein [Cognataquiflexum rubidum]|uniref:nuclear transport factor 2 family protein n=1 Tax=Cognataquiflexum rubidum TaxID=2922273 RepID=UPI001F1332D2|nr:nuclear transport factor 2 family protein [Cognataquiflexum rubidum]MCH6232857.1 nuclear transport factor 2 family protein [Cognataquiflexum rubidum]
MKIIVTIILTTFCLQSFAQKNPNIQATKPSETVRQEIIQIMQNSIVAWGDSDTLTLSKLLAPEYRHSDIYGKILTRQEWLNYAAKPRSVTDYKTDDVDIVLYNNNLALVTGKNSHQSSKSTKRTELRFTQVWIKNNGQWKRSAFQGTLIDESK